MYKKTSILLLMTGVVYVIKKKYYTQDTGQ